MSRAALLCLVFFVGCNGVVRARGSSEAPRAPASSASGPDVVDGGATLDDPDAGAPAEVVDAGATTAPAAGDAGVAEPGPAPDAGIVALVCTDFPDGGDPVAMPALPTPECAVPSQTEVPQSCATFRNRFGEPRTYSLLPGAGDPLCVTVGSSDGEGNVAVGYVYDSFIDEAQYTVLAPDRRMVGSFQAMGPSDLMGQAHGFQVGEYIIGSAGYYGGPLLSFDSDTNSSSSTTILEDDFPAIPARYGRDPAGGTLAGLWKYEAGGWSLYLWDADGAGRVRPGFPVRIFRVPECEFVNRSLAVARSVRGDFLVIWQGDSIFGGGTLAAQWFDAQGHPETGIFDARLTSTQDIVAKPLADGHVAIKLEGQWAYAFAPGETAPEPAPCWLQARPDTDVFLVHGNSMQALISSKGMSCDQALELVDANGASCGTFAVDSPSESCGTGRVSIGADGTVLENGGYETVQTLYGPRTACLERWWPALLQ
jgi:hypothetical protein